MRYAVLVSVAQFERVLRERTVAGLHAAKRRGEVLGRRPVLTRAQVREAKAMVDRGESPSHIARILRVGRSTLYRHLGNSSKPPLISRHYVITSLRQRTGRAITRVQSSRHHPRRCDSRRVVRTYFTNRCQLTGVRTDVSDGRGSGVDRFRKSVGSLRAKL